MSLATRTLTDYASVTDYLFALKSVGVKFGIDRMWSFATALGHPERRYPIIHIAGTNGKGSVSAMIETILRESGLHTGLYTSPHLVKIGERVQVDRNPLTEDEIVNYMRELVPVAEKLRAIGPDEYPTFFEFIAAMAFLQFAHKKVNVAVIEVGLGGLLDATNIVVPEVAVITSIGLDHTEQLGNTFACIAREKAGIIKSRVPVVIGRVPGEAEKVIRTLAHEHEAPLYSVREIYGEGIERYPATNLNGDYQRWNAATATLAAGLLRTRFALSDEAIENGLLQVDWPGRWQQIMVGKRLLVLDASHNPEGAQVLESNLCHLLAENDGRKPIIITSVLGEFRARPLLKVIGRYARKIYLVSLQQARACTHEEMKALTPKTAQNLLHCATLEEVIPILLGESVGGSSDTVVVTGSIYLLGEVLARLQPILAVGNGRLQNFNFVPRVVAQSADQTRAISSAVAGTSRIICEGAGPTPR